MSAHVRFWLRSVAWVNLLFALCPLLHERVPGADELPSDAAIHAAVTKSLPLLEKGALGSLEQRKQCFTCHNQGLPILALTTAKARGFEIDGEHLRKQLQFTADFLGKNKDRYREGKGQGGQVDTAGYALWTLDNGSWQADETTAAVAEYFLLYQKELDHWQPQSRRPPSEQSPFTSSYIALRGLKKFGIPDQQERIAQRCEQVRAWLLKSDPQDTEDRVFRLRALSVVGACVDDVRRAAESLIETQRPDGGWAQLPEAESDAYATGSALVALHDAGSMKTCDLKYRQGLGYLIRSQLADGSWHVSSRSKPFQTYFESGYPHGKDQFISIAAASWGTTALALALPIKVARSGSVARFCSSQEVEYSMLSESPKQSSPRPGLSRSSVDWTATRRRQPTSPPLGSPQQSADFFSYSDGELSDLALRCRYKVVSPLGPAQRRTKFPGAGW